MQNAFLGEYPSIFVNITRKGRDSNPWGQLRPTDFPGRSFQPLTHPSNSSLIASLSASRRAFPSNLLQRSAFRLRIFSVLPNEWRAHDVRCSSFHANRHVSMLCSSPSPLAFLFLLRIAHPAEAVGFEPTGPLRARLFSKQVPSTTRPRFQTSLETCGRGGSRTPKAVTLCCFQGSFRHQSICSSMSN